MAFKVAVSVITKNTNQVIWRQVHMQLEGNHEILEDVLKGFALIKKDVNEDLQTDNIKRQFGKVLFKDVDIRVVFLKQW